MGLTRRDSKCIAFSPHVASSRSSVVLAGVFTCSFAYSQQSMDHFVTWSHGKKGIFIFSFFLDVENDDFSLRGMNQVASLLLFPADVIAMSKKKEKDIDP